MLRGQSRNARKLFKLLLRFKDMNKKGSATVIIAVIVVIGVLAYFIFFSGKNTNLEDQGGQEDNRLEECSLMSEASIDEAFEKWDCYTDLAKGEKSISICDLIPLENEDGAAYLNRYTCYRMIAVATKDIAICEKIPLRVAGGRFGGRSLCERETSLVL